MEIGEQIKTNGDSIRGKDHIDTSDLNTVFRRCSGSRTNPVVSSGSVRVIRRDILILCDWHLDKLCTRESRETSFTASP